MRKLTKSFLPKSEVPLLEVIAWALATNQELPKEVIEAFVKAVAWGAQGKIASWDHVFGRPNTKEQYGHFLRDWEAAPQIAEQVEQAKTIDNESLEAIGRDLGIGGSTKVKELLRLYRQMKREAR